MTNKEKLENELHAEKARLMAVLKHLRHLEKIGKLSKRQFDEQITEVLDMMNEVLRKLKDL